MNRQKGFTLIELLVVIAIIAILAAILFPVMTAAKESAQVTQCCANLSQISKAVSMYVDEYNGWYPAPARPWKAGENKIYPQHDPTVCTWDLVILKYLKSPAVFKCPVDKNTRLPWNGIDKPLPRSYTINDNATIARRRAQSNVPDYSAWHSSQIKPMFSRFIYIIEQPGNASTLPQNDLGAWMFCSQERGIAPKIGVHRQGKIMNYLFFDGHVAGMNPKIANSDVQKWEWFAGDK